jgi:hypothetical protein
MKRICLLLIGVLALGLSTFAADLSTASSQDLLGIYKQLRSLQGSGDGAATENVVFKRDAATFTFASGRIAFAAPVSGHVVAAKFQGEGIFELEPPANVDKRQISRVAKGPKLTDTFREAVFYFTDDTFAELSKLLKIQSIPSAAPSLTVFSSFQKELAENYNDWIENQRKGYPSIRNVAARMLSDMADGTSKGFFLASFKGKGIGDLLFHISWNREPLLLPDYGKSEEVMLVHANAGGYREGTYEWISGFHLSSEYAKSPHPDHRNFLASCPSMAINLQIAKDNTLNAVADMEYVIVEGAPRMLPFNLNGVLRISAIEDSAGNKLSFIQEDRKLDSDPWLILSEPAKPGEKRKIKITYIENSTGDSRIIFNRGSGLFYVTARESWFPSFGSFDDRTQFQLNARSPKKFKFVASGTLVSSEKTNDELVTTWKSEIPFGVFGFNYGEFVEASQPSPNLTVTAYSGKEVPNELKAIEARMSELTLAGKQRDVINSGILTGGFNTAANVKYAAGLSFQAFRLFEFLFGPLPYKTVSITEQPVRGYGQSWPNLVFLPYDSLLDATTRNSLGLQDSGEAREFYSLVAVHEMAHQWWGHLVGWKTYHDQWLSEGIAEFASGMYLRQFEPKQLGSFWDTKRTYLLSKNQYGFRSVDAGPIWLNAQLGVPNLIYSKGAYVMEMLRVIMYDPKIKNPDGRFIAMMQDFAGSYAGQNASTDDFRKIVEKHTGEPMQWFFNQWVYGTAVPTYDFSYALADAGDGQTELTMTIAQSNVGDSFQMRLPVYIAIKGEMRYLGTVSALGAKPQKISVKLPVRPEKVLLDPGKSILAEIRQ